MEEKYIIDEQVWTADEGVDTGYQLFDEESKSDESVTLQEVTTNARLFVNWVTEDELSYTIAGLQSPISEYEQGGLKLSVQNGGDTDVDIDDLVAQYYLPSMGEGSDKNYYTQTFNLWGTALENYIGSDRTRRLYGYVRVRTATWDGSCWPVPCELGMANNPMITWFRTPIIEDNYYSPDAGFDFYENGYFQIRIRNLGLPRGWGNSERLIAMLYDTRQELPFTVDANRRVRGSTTGIIASWVTSNDAQYAPIDGEDNVQSRGLTCNLKNATLEPGVAYRVFFCRQFHIDDTTFTFVIGPDADGYEFICPDDIDNPPSPQDDYWHWYESNGDATAEQTEQAYRAISNRGEISDFHHLVWNDLVEKVKTMSTRDMLGWVRKDANGNDLLNSSDTKMTDDDRTLTAIRYNSLLYNINRGYIKHFGNDIGISYVYSQDKVYGNEHFIKLVDALNDWIDAINNR